MYSYDPDPLMPLHLSSSATRLGDLAVAVYLAIDDVGLRLPSRRDVARHSRVSEATVSRRVREVSGEASGEERVAGVIASARERTYPPGSPYDGWRRWIPESEIDVQDVRVWLACLSMAAHSSAVGDAVLSAWEHEHRELLHQLTGTVHAPDDPCDSEGALDAEALLALLLGLTIRRLLDPEVTSDQALASLHRVLAALGHPIT